MRQRLGQGLEKSQVLQFVRDINSKLAARGKGVSRKRDERGVGGKRDQRGGKERREQWAIVRE